ncbi:MAG: glucokinase [Acidobacteria bacterium]|jgi:glucokinase|nr:glucokinase [Acidobacteriota bacterium]
MILAGDVGGTKVHLALYDFSQGSLVHLQDERFPAQDYDGLEAIVRKFLSQCPQGDITAACFGVPGPVRHGRLKLTNLPWTLDSEQLSSALNIPHLFLINDLEANGYGVAELKPDQIFTLNAGDRGAVGNRALVSAGTGLGEGVMVWDGHRHVPMASEGGHCDFAARNPLEIELLQYLMKKLDGRVSFERVVSGLGIHNIYQFLRDVKKMEESPELKERLMHEDPNAVIGELGDDGKDELCVRTLEVFVSAYGAEAGNMALKVLAVGGMYIGGGIAPKILNTMRSGVFMNAFTDKGRLSDLLIKTPVHVILESRCALMGAAAYAEQRAAELSGRSVRAASI